MDIDDKHAKAVADEIMNAYRDWKHERASEIFTSYINRYDLTDVPAMWHHLARTIAHAYSAAGQSVVDQDVNESPSGSDISVVNDGHSRRLVVLCQRHSLDARDAVRTYAESLGTADHLLWRGITLHLASRAAELTGPFANRSIRHQDSSSPEGKLSDDR